MSGIKINLDSLKNSYNGKPDEKKKLNTETSTNEDSAVKDSINTQNTGENEGEDKKINLKIGKKEELPEDKKEKSPVKTTKINLAGIRSLDNTSEEVNKKEESLSAEHNCDENSCSYEVQENENKELFVKYQSDFEKNKETVLEKIKKLKNIPKTRLGFLATLVLITSIGISSLFYISPEVHSIKNYKASILGLFNNEINNDKEKVIENLTNSGENKDNEQIIVQTNTNTGNINSASGSIIENDNDLTISKSGFKIEYEKQLIEGEEKIIYNGMEYETTEDFEASIDKVIIRLKKEKLSDFFKKENN